MGTANARPDSRTPRRLTSASTITSTADIGAAYGVKKRNAEVTATTPEVTDTATVIT